MPNDLINDLKAGAAYFAIVFAIGFLLGTIRVLILIPSLGETVPVVIEIPIMLAASWIASAWLIRRRGIPAILRDRLIMGLSAFTLLMIAELSLSILAFDRSLIDHFDAYKSLPQLLGLLGQILFASIPILQMDRKP